MPGAGGKGSVEEVGEGNLDVAEGVFGGGDEGAEFGTFRGGEEAQGAGMAPDFEAGAELDGLAVEVGGAGGVALVPRT